MIFGLGIHVLIALYFGIHAIRHGRELYWLVVLFMFPGFGSVVYFFAVYLPDSRLDRNIGKAGELVRKTLDPGRALRDAQRAFDLTPTAHNQTQLASAMLDAGMYAEAVAQFAACLSGPFAGDPEIRFAAAQARLANRQPDAAIRALEELAQTHPSFRQEQLGIVLARSYAAAARQVEAGATFAATVERFPSIEARAEYAIWALGQRDRVVADAQLKELAHSRKHMTKYTKSLHQDLFKRLDAAAKG